MKYKWKKMIALSLVICMFGMSVTGCGSVPAAGDEVNAPAKLNAPEPITNDADEAENNTNYADEDTGKADASTNMDESETDIAKSEEPINNSASDSDDATSGKWQVYDADVAAATDADFEGVVHKIDADSFYIYPMETSLTEDGALISSSLSADAEVPDEELLQVVFTNDTNFTLRDIYDGGARYEDSDSSFENIEKGVTVALKGEFQNDIFHANAIRINKIH